MKYLVRSIKYFFYLMIILTVIILALVLTKFVDADLSTMFVNGYDSLWQIAIIMAVFALVYPRFGFSTRTAHVYGSPEETRPAVMKVMDLHGYRLESEDVETMTFVKKSVLARILKMYEDRLTLTRTGAGIEVEGLTKDMVRIVSGLEATQQSDE